MVLNIDRINEIKKKDILNGIDYLQKSDRERMIKKLIIFGSSVSDRCDKDSDIDMSIVTTVSSRDRGFNELLGVLSAKMGGVCDILLYDRLTGRIKEEVDRKGVVVYECQ